MSRNLIVNADDFGLAECINRGVVRAYRDGILTSATMLANGHAFAHAVDCLADCPGLGVGVHLNALRGRPLADPAAVKAICDADGRLRLHAEPLWRVCRDPSILSAMEAEYRAQIEAVCAVGISPTHLDSEKHHAVWTPVRGLLIRLAREYSIPAIRCLREPVALATRCMPWPGMHRLLNAAALRTYVTLFHRTPPVWQPDYFWGQTHIGRMQREAWLGLLQHLPEGTSEVMVHPGEMDAEEMRHVDSVFGPSWIDDGRPLELQALLEPVLRDMVAARGIMLIPYPASSPAGEACRN